MASSLYKIMLAFAILIITQPYLSGTTVLLSELCGEPKTVYTSPNDSLFRNIDRNRCDQVVGSGVPYIPGVYHCKSVTKAYPSTPGEKVELAFASDYIIGAPNDNPNNITGVLLIFNGDIDESILSKSFCNGNTPTSPATLPVLDTLFDSRKHGTRFANLTKSSVKSTASNGAVTIVILLLSPDFGTFSFIRMPSDLPVDPNECKLSCNDQVNISLDGACGRTIIPADVMNNIDPNRCTDLRVILNYPYPEYYTSKFGGRTDTVDGTLIGYCMVYKVMDISNGNSCWGYICIEDKYPPQIICMNDTISCIAADQYTLQVTAGDNCTLYAPDPKIEHLERKWVSYDCDQDSCLIGYMARKVRAIDLWGNYNECVDTLFLYKENIDSLVCPPDTNMECTFKLSNGKEKLWDDNHFYDGDDGYRHPFPTDGAGMFPAPYLNSKDTSQTTGGQVYLMDIDNKGKCHIVWDYKDWVIPTCGKSYKIRREWKIYDWCNNSDTSCIQWIKITDTSAPQLNPTLIVLKDTSKYPDKALIAPHRFINTLDIKGYTKPHDCKAHIVITDIREYVMKECDMELELEFEVKYPDPTHPGKEVIITGSIAEGASKTIYLPNGWHWILYTLRDRCWNETRVWRRAYVVDNTPPTPVCDEITQVTLDPEKCWARVYAEDLDDGSHDNCCEYLHFAVANMDSIEYYRNKWVNDIIACNDHYYYLDHKEEIDKRIEDWINCYVFNDYIDLTECGRDTLVLRVYEACDLPVYDPHIFVGTKHQWFCFNLWDEYACWFRWKYREFANYENPIPDICAPSLIWSKTCLAAGGSLPLNDRDSGLYCEIATDHYPYRNYVACVYENSGDSRYPTWQKLLTDYPELLYNDKHRYCFKHLYNDCMIEVIKDDKEPPVCKAPDDVTYYCDGVPYHWKVPVGVDFVEGWGAGYAHDICSERDKFRSDCPLDKTPVQTWLVTSSTDGSALDNWPIWCVNTPWDGTDLDPNHRNYGYYGGPVCDEYTNSYETYSGCDDNYWGPDGTAHSWKPIYCRVWLTLDYYDDPSYEKPDPEQYFGTPSYLDNCWFPDIRKETEGSLNECGVGVLTRTWTVTDKCENTSVCYQRVVIKPRSDFEVHFPEDIHVDCADGQDLSATAAGAGYPVIHDDDCELIGIHYEDRRFDITDEACYKILRTWTIIDWCVYDPDQHYRHPDVIVDDRYVASDERCCVHNWLKDDGDGYVTYLQVIKVTDVNPPVATCNEMEEVCIYDENCAGADVEQVIGTAVDSCTPADEIRYRHYVDPYESGDESTYLYFHGNVLEGNFPVGTHGVHLIATDNCGNEDTCWTTLTIRDCKKPTPYCYNGIATVIMPSSNEVEVWASDLDAGSYDNCTLKENLVFTFDSAGEVSSRVFTCDDLGQVSLDIWVWDEEGNSDFCNTYLLIQPGVDACEGLATSTIKGEVINESEIPVEFVQVDLMNTQRTFNTGADGKFAFSALPMGQEYEVMPYRNDNHDNGVSTLDIVQITKHILGKSKLENSYRVIAADINSDSKVTALDIVELRKLILGIYNEFPNNTSWRFVDAGYEFSNPDKPWGFAESVTIENMSTTEVEVNFVGVKVGDVNGSSKANSAQLQGAEIRTSEKLIFAVEDAAISAGEEVKISFKAKSFAGVEGYQFTLNIPGMEVVNIEAASLQVDENNFGLIRQGVVTTSWNESAGVNVADDATLFTVTAIAQESGQLSKLLTVNSAVTRAEAYVNGEQVGIGVEFTTEGKVIASGDYSLYQNTPNPFTDETIIGFVLAEAGEATVKVMDVTGKTLKVYQGDFAKGYNEVKVVKKELNTTGVLYYQLESGDFVATKKMVVID